MPKRHPSLIPLSREHHLGLLLAFRLRRGLPRTRKPTDSPQEQATDTAHFFHTHLTMHFRAEEEVLFPAIRSCWPQASPLLDSLLAEHAEIRDMVEQLTYMTADDVVLPARLRSFGDVLEHHIRREERDLFPLAETHLPEPELARLGAAIAHFIGEGR